VGQDLNERKQGRIHKAFDKCMGALSKKKHFEKKRVREKTGNMGTG